MNKLDQIEANANLQRGWADSDDTAWLIARVRKLEAEFVKIRDLDSDSTLDPEEAYGYELALEKVYDLARQALQED